MTKAKREVVYCINCGTIRKKEGKGCTYHITMKASAAVLRKWRRLIDPTPRAIPPAFYPA